MKNIIYNTEGQIIGKEDLEVGPKSWDAYDFKLRFTQDERKAIRAAAKVNADVEDFMDLLDTAAATGTRIVADNAELIAGLNLMEDAGLIGEGRAAEILGG